MSETTTSFPLIATHLYRLSPHMRWRLRILGTMLFGSSFFFLFIGINIFFLPLLTPLLAVLVLMVSSLFFALGWMHWYNAEHMDLTLTPNTFCIQAFGYILTSSWSNVRRIGNRWGEKWLFLDQPATVAGPLAWLARLYGFDRFIHPGRAHLNSSINVVFCSQVMLIIAK